MIPFQEWLVEPQARQMVLVLFSAVGLLLLLGCANISNLLLALGDDALLAARVSGAGRARLIRQLLTESCCSPAWERPPAAASVRGVPARHGRSVLDVCAAAGGGEPGRPGARVHPRAVCRDRAPVRARARPPGSRDGLAPLLQQGGRAAMAQPAGDCARPRDRELALAMMLLIGAGLMYRQLPAVGRTWTRVSIRMAWWRSGSTSLRRTNIRRASGCAFLRGGAPARRLPPRRRLGGRHERRPVRLVRPRINYTVDGRAPQRQSDFLSADWRSVTPGFFRALGIPLRKGRLFSAEDREGAEKVVVINETMARSLWPGEDPIGKRILWTGLASKPRTVIGVVGDIRDMQLDGEIRQVLFRPYAQMTWPWMTLVIKTTGESPTSAISRCSPAGDPCGDRNLPVPDLVPLRQSLAGPLAAPRFGMLLLGVFAAVALILAATGVYGIMMFAVTQRTREIGVRLALGAQPWSVVRMILSRGLLLTLTGVGSGGPALSG